MRLINLSTFRLEEFFDFDIPPYAILSHTWGDEEISFQQFEQISFRNLSKLAGHKKIRSFCQRAAADGHKYAWIDTCCIDKSSSSELSEAITSMFEWYRRAEMCYAYLCDVHWSSEAADGPVGDSSSHWYSFRKSRWFTRGWTLQELIAPKDVRFYAANWMRIASKKSISKLLSKITGIDATVLLDAGKLASCSVAARMSWAADRSTKRREDIAYSLLGIFNIRMPLIYGEGHDAFLRLQQQILETIDDDSILAWSPLQGASTFKEGYDMASHLGVLAKHPSFFRRRNHIQPAKSNEPWISTPHGLQIDRSRWVRRRPYTWDLQLSCWITVDGEHHHPRIPMMSTSRGYYGRRNECLIFGPKNKLSSEVHDEEDRVYLLKYDTRRREPLQAPITCEVPRMITTTESNHPAKFVLVKTELWDMLGKIVNETSISGPPQTISLRAHKVSTILLSYELIGTLEGPYSKGLQICLYSRGHWQDWCLEARNWADPYWTPSGTASFLEAFVPQKCYEVGESWKSNYWQLAPIKTDDVTRFYKIRMHAGLEIQAQSVLKLVVDAECNDDVVRTQGKIKLSTARKLGLRSVLPKVKNY